MTNPIISYGKSPTKPVSLQQMFHFNRGSTVSHDISLLPHEYGNRIHSQGHILWACKTGERLVDYGGNILLQYIVVEGHTAFPPDSHYRDIKLVL